MIVSKTSVDNVKQLCQEWADAFNSKFHLHIFPEKAQRLPGCSKHIIPCETSAETPKTTIFPKINMVSEVDHVELQTYKKPHTNLSIVILVN